MSTSLYFRPVVDENGETLSFALKKALSQKYWEHDGSLGGNWVKLSNSDISFLEGVNAGGVSDAKVLIAEIIKHGQIEVALIG